MRRALRQAITIAVLSAIALAGAPAAQSAADTAGTVHFVRPANTEFDSFTSNPSPAGQAWLRAHMWRMIGWSPFFDEKTSWFPQAWLYQDAYAIYKSSPLVQTHPEWILHDAAGNKLYIPFGCSNGSCPQYAGDISNPAFRHNWIEEARTRLAHGYKGLFVDDVNMEERVGNSSENSLLPIGMGGAISPAAWRADMAEFMAEIRAAFPGAEIVHNAIWYAASGAGPSDPAIRREIESANYVMLERGVNDSGITGGNGQFSLNAMLSYVDAIHAMGRGIVMDGSAGDPQGMEYNLASYFLASKGNDAVSAAGQTPASWWPGFDVNLGEAAGPRYAWSGLLRRDFSAGTVLVNPPGAPTQAVSLPSAMRTAGGATVTSITLPAGSGAVLQGAVAAPAGAVAGETVTSIATQTSLEARVIGPRPFGSSGRARAGHRGGSHRAFRHGGRAHAARRGGSGQAHGRWALASISGVVHRAMQGTVTLSLEVRRGRRWARVAHVTLGVDSGGRFFRLVRLRRAHVYRMLATYQGAAGYRPSSSGYRLLALRGG